MITPIKVAELELLVAAGPEELDTSQPLPGQQKSSQLNWELLEGVPELLPPAVEDEERLLLDGDEESEEFCASAEEELGFSSASGPLGLLQETVSSASASPGMSAVNGKKRGIEGMEISPWASRCFEYIWQCLKVFAKLW